MEARYWEIGMKIRAIRTGLAMTQQQLADQCCLSKGMISKVENGVVLPALATLTKIACALRVKVADLIEADQKAITLHTLNPFRDGSRFLLTDKGYRFFSPTTGMLGRMAQPILIVAREGEAKEHTVSHPGEEYIFIFEGEMIFRVANERYLLRKGDSLFFDAVQPHGITSVIGEVQYIDIFIGSQIKATPKTEEE